MSDQTEDRPVVTFRFEVWSTEKVPELLDGTEEDDDEDEAIEIMGYERWPAKMEEALRTAPIGEEVRMRLTPAQGWGDWDPSCMIEVPTRVVKAQTLPDGSPAFYRVGDELTIEVDGAQTFGVIEEMDEDLTILDTNHPFAGLKVDLYLTVVERRPSTLTERTRAEQGMEID